MGALGWDRDERSLYYKRMALCEKLSIKLDREQQDKPQSDPKVVSL